MTKAEKELLAKLLAKREEWRAKERERWRARTQGKAGKAYLKEKAEKKKEWQKKNATVHTLHVQRFYERWNLSGRAARARGKPKDAEPEDQQSDQGDSS